MISGAMDDRSFDVLTAGIKKLLRDGKNRLILELLDTGKLESRFIREIIGLNFLAQELDGQLVVRTEDAQALFWLMHFTRSKSIHFFQKKEDAIKKFEESGTPNEKEEKPAVELESALQTKDNELLILKKQLQDKEGGEMGQLRKENAQLKEANTKFTEVVEDLMKKRREPSDITTCQEKVKVLETRIEELVGQIEKLSAKK